MKLTNQQILIKLEIIIDALVDLNEDSDFKRDIIRTYLDKFNSMHFDVMDEIENE